MLLGDSLTVLERREPSATCFLVRGVGGAILVDAGFGTALADVERLVRAAGVEPAALQLLALTHMHSDHAGAVGGLQARHGVTVALHHAEAALVHARSPDAGDARWLGHAYAPYRVEHPLADGDVLQVDGGPQLVVVELAAQTPGHVAFHLPDSGLVLTGDLLQEHDVSWVPPGRAAIEAALRALDRIEATGARRALPGHGPPVPDVPAAIERSRERYARWLEDPTRSAWHAVKRLAVTALQTAPPAAGGEPAMLAAVPAVRDHAAGLGLQTQEFARAVLDDLRRVGAVRDTPAGVRPTGEHDPPAPHPYGPLRPADWPEDLVARPGEWVWP